MKIETNFTPGPWETKKRNIGFSEADFIIASKSQKYSDAIMHVSIGEKKYGWSTKESTANARLIAKAPDMFDILYEMSFVEPNSLYHIIQRAKKLIEQVTGKSIEELEKTE